MNKLLTILILIAGIHFSANCQSFNLLSQGNSKNLIGLKVHNPLFKSDETYDQMSGLSGAYTIYGLFNLKNKWNIYSELPIIVAKSEYGNNNGLGNIFVALSKGLNESQSSLISIGAFLPTMGKENYFKQEIGLYSNLYRIPQFIEGVTIYGNYSYFLPEDKKGIFGFEVGPDIAIPINEGDVEFLLHAGIKGGVRISKLSLWSEFNGILIISEAGSGISDSSLSQLLFGGQIDLGKVDPGICYTIPFKEYMREIMSGVLGLKIDIEI